MQNRKQTYEITKDSLIGSTSNSARTTIWTQKNEEFNECTPVCAGKATNLHEKIEGYEESVVVVDIFCRNTGKG